MALGWAVPSPRRSAPRRSVPDLFTWGCIADEMVSKLQLVQFIASSHGFNYWLVYWETKKRSGWTSALGENKNIAPFSGLSLILDTSFPLPIPAPLIFPTLGPDVKKGAACRLRCPQSACSVPPLAVPTPPATLSLPWLRGHSHLQSAAVQQAGAAWTVNFLRVFFCI